MKKKIIIVTLIILIGTVAAVGGLKHRMHSMSQQETLAQAESEARQKSNLPACLNIQTQNEPNETDANAISGVVGAKLTDRPKTTAYGLYYKSFSSTGATGTIIYDGTSGNTFNFTVNRASETGVWQLTDFEACQ